jgi:leader peptidase (prepilin peptidase)/N-methyltransferase
MSAFEALTQPGIFVAVCAVVGLCVGSFLNVVVHRLPKMMEREWQMQCAELRGEPAPASAPFGLVRPRSTCPKCGHAISAIENIPILSYLWLRGRCRACSAPISLRYPTVEVLTALLSAGAALHFGATYAGIGALVFLWCLIALTFIDIDTQLLPDSITLPLIWSGLFFNLSGTFTNLSSAVIGAMAGYLSLWSVFWLFKLATGKEGMGFGDFKLLAAIGAWLGWQLLPLSILLASLVGAVVGVTLIVLARHGMGIPIPFGPYLATAGAIALFWGKPLTDHYLRLL